MLLRRQWKPSKAGASSRVRKTDSRFVFRPPLKSTSGCSDIKPHPFASSVWLQGCLPTRRVLYRSWREVPPSWKRMGKGMQVSYKRVPFVRKSNCTACGLCESVCPHACLDVLGGSGALVQPEACTSEGDCLSICPESAIQMRWVRLNSNRSIGQWRVRALKTRQPQQSSA